MKPRNVHIRSLLRRLQLGWGMFTIEHDFDATVITLVDEGAVHLQEDVTISNFEDCVTVEQYDPQSDRVMKVTFSFTQLRELRAALDLPEGIYRLRPGPPEPEPPAGGASS